jgi:hypothetical protein
MFLVEKRGSLSLFVGKGASSMFSLIHDSDLIEADLGFELRVKDGAVEAEMVEVYR